MTKKRRHTKAKPTKRTSKPKRKATYRVRNWRAYNSQLVQGGSSTLWISEDVLENWHLQPEGSRQRGGQVLYSDQAIACLLMLRAAFQLPYRQAEGLGQSRMDLWEADVTVPDYTTVCKRSADPAVSLPTNRPDEAKHILRRLRCTARGAHRGAPQRNARIWQHGNSSKPPLPRDQTLRRIRRVGRKRWKQESGYHRRSLAETAVFRFKIIFGNRLSARTMPRQITEARIKCAALNRMTHLGMPDSYRVA